MQMDVVPSMGDIADGDEKHSGGASCSDVSTEFVAQMINELLSGQQHHGEKKMPAS
jgi:hypothetical protein